MLAGSPPPDATGTSTGPIRASGGSSSTGGQSDQRRGRSSPSGRDGFDEEGTQTFPLEAALSEKFAGQALATCEAEQEVFGTDIVVSERPRLAPTSRRQTRCI